jgi:hypothetical protein
MKRFIYILAAAATIALGGCTKEVVSDLTGGSDERANALVGEWRGELIAAEHGWLANVTTSDGIYRFWMDFQEKDVVTMYTDNLRYPDNNGVPQNSSYRLQAFRAPTIVFDTYSYLSQLNDPDNSISGGEENLGLVTDFEFEIVDYVDGKFTLRGRMNAVPASLTRATEQEYRAVREGRLMDQLGTIPAYSAGKTLEFTVGDKTVAVILRQRNLTAVTTGGGDVGVQRTFTYVSMANGDILFDSPLEVDGVKFSGLKWDEANSSYELLLSDTGEFRLAAVDRPSFPMHEVYGMGKAFKRLRFFYDEQLSLLRGLGTSNPVYSGMYTQPGLVESFVGLPAHTGLNTIANVFVAGSHTEYVDVYFDHDGENEGFKLVLSVSMIIGGSRTLADYSYKVTFDQTDPSRFTVDTTPTYGSLAAILYEESKELHIFIENLFDYYVRPTQAIVDAFAGRTFKMDWSAVRYGSEIMGELRSVDGGTEAIYIGGITE